MITSASAARVGMCLMGIAAALAGTSAPATAQELGGVGIAPLEQEALPKRPEPQFRAASYEDLEGLR